MSISKMVLTNQFGEESINVVEGTVFPISATGNLIIMTGASAPTSGASGTGDNIAGKGSIYIAQDTGLMYLQVGAITAPSWTIVEAGSAAVLATVITGYVSGAGAVAASDTILQALNKLNGNAAAIKTTADAALPSAGFTNAAVKALASFKMTHQADSVAADVAAMVVDFNALLAKLQSSGFML